jgi:flagellum-specific peptidoglycan hydrolase FlgJ
MINKDFAQMVFSAAENMDISPLFVTAQAALESGWGKHVIGKYNFFGITADEHYTGKTLMVRTREVFNIANKILPSNWVLHSVTKRKDGLYDYDLSRPFRDYDTLEQALNDHFDILRSDNFKAAWTFRNDPVKFVTAIQSGKKKYATDPNYVSTMKSMFVSVQRLLA